jgi:predicted MPP superfamily phosphohydrolase
VLHERVREWGLDMRRRTIIAAGISAATMTLMGCASGSIFNNAAPELKVLEIGLGRSVAFIADLHIHRLGEEHAENTLKALEGSGAEFFILGGDMVDEETVDITSLDWFLRELNIQRGYAVLGNHEYWSHKVVDTVEALRTHNIEILNDKTISTPFGRLLGLDWRESRQYGRWKFDSLVAVHDPNAADHVDGNAFIMAGHTHGGLILYGYTLFTNSKYVRGLYRLSGDTKLYVTRGVGQMFLQIRVNSPPEIVLLV